MLLNQICGMDLSQDYSLEDIISTVNDDLSVSPNIKQDINNRPEALLLEENIKIKRAEVDIARSRFMPNIIASGNYILSNPNLFNGFDKSFSGMFSVGIGVTVPIFHFGDRIHTLSAAKHNLRIAELTKEEALEKMELQANMKRNSKNEAAKQSTLANNNMLHAEENLRMAQAGFEEGVVSASDLMQAQTAWVSAKSEIIDAKINLALTELYFNQALGKVNVPQIDRKERKK